MKNHLLTLLIFCSALGIQAQDISTGLNVGDYTAILLKEGTTLKGTIKAINVTTIVTETNALGTLTIIKTQIESITKLTEKEFFSDEPTEGAYFDNPLPNKNYLTETAIGLKKGEGFYQNILIGAHIFSYGISDNFSLSGGFETFTLFAGESPLFFITPKFTFPNKSENLHFGIGGNLLLIPDGGGRELAGSLFGLTTFGSKNNNATLGLGFAFSEDDFSSEPALQIGGMTRLGKHFMLIADQVVVFTNSVTVVGTWTVRYMTPKVSLDLGAAVAYEGGSIPVLGASIKF